MSARWAGVCLAIAFLWFAFQAAIGLSMPEFGDESSKIVVAMMILDGGTLYRDVIHHHSPGIFALAHGWAAVVGTTDLMPFRAFMAGLVLAGAAAVALSPVLRTSSGRIFAAAGYLLVAGTLYNALSLYRMIYQSTGGIAMLAFLALLVVPLLIGRPGGRAISAAGGAAAGLGIAINTGLAAPAAALALAGIFVHWRRPDRGPAGGWPWLLAALAGFGAAIAAVLVWMIGFADFRGFLVFNFYFNTEIYAPFADFHILGAPATAIGLNPAGFGPIHLYVYGALLAGLALLVRAWREAEALPGRCALVVAGLLVATAMIYMNPRASLSLHTATLALAALGVLMPLAGRLVETIRRGPIFAASVAALLLCGSIAFYATAFSSPMSARLASLWPTFEEPLDPLRVDPGVRLIVRLVPEGEPIQAFPFLPAIYLAADRPPASSRLFYLPWDAAYERSPVPGYGADICAEMRRARPLAIVALPGRVWDRWSLEDYAPCVTAFLAADYLRHPRTDWLYVLSSEMGGHPWLSREFGSPGGEE